MATSEGAVRAALTAAVGVARLAPSVHNTQPWRWRLAANGLVLRADRRRQLPVADPDGLLLTQSCGTALHHALIALAADGWLTRVRRLPDPADADLFAEIELTGRGGPDPAAAELAQAARQRRTDRRPLTDRPVGDAVLGLIVAAIAGEHTNLHLLHPDEILNLAAAMSHATEAQAGEESFRIELAGWVGAGRPDATGIPAAAIPEQPPRTRVPGRFFGPPGTLLVDDGHDRAARYAVLHGDTDTPVAWLHAGEALSAGWLTATRHGLSVLPISAPVEIPATRERLRHLLAGLGYPYLAMRIGNPDTGQPGPPATPRLPIGEILDADRAGDGGADER
jgi:nitroreductase